MAQQIGMVLVIAGVGYGLLSTAAAATGLYSGYVALTAWFCLTAAVGARLRQRQVSLSPSRQAITLTVWSQLVVLLGYLLRLSELGENSTQVGVALLGSALLHYAIAWVSVVSLPAASRMTRNRIGRRP